MTGFAGTTRPDNTAPHADQAQPNLAVEIDVARVCHGALGWPFAAAIAAGLLLALLAWGTAEFWDETLDALPEESPTKRPTMLRSGPPTALAPSEIKPKNSAFIRDPIFKSGTAGAPIVVTPDVAGCGRASWYALYSKTASGERMNPAKLTAAHKTLHFGTKLKVTNTSNGRSVVVRINDRGPFVQDRVLDLSKAAGSQIGMIRAGHAKVCYQPLPSRSVRRPLCSTAPGCTRV